MLKMHNKMFKFSKKFDIHFMETTNTNCVDIALVFSFLSLTPALAAAGIFIYLALLKLGLIKSPRGLVSPQVQ